MKQYEYILFDWDGCLAMSIDVWIETAQQILKHEGLQLTAQQIFAVFGKQGIMSYFPVANPQASQDELIVRATPKLRRVKLYDGVKNCLQALRAQGKATAIVSDCRRDILEAGLAHNGLDEYFDATIARDDAARRKPHPDSINLALAIFGAPSASCIMIGDTEKDLLAAQSAGVDSALFYPPSHGRLYDASRLQTHNPTYQVGSHAELSELLLQPVRVDKHLVEMV